MGSFQSDDEDDDADASDKEMGVDAEDGDEASSARHKKFAAQVCHTFYILFKGTIRKMVTPYLKKKALLQLLISFLKCKKLYLWSYRMYLSCTSISLFYRNTIIFC